MAMNSSTDMAPDPSVSYFTNSSSGESYRCNKRLEPSVGQKRDPVTYFGCESRHCLALVLLVQLVLTRVPSDRGFVIARLAVCTKEIEFVTWGRSSWRLALGWRRRSHRRPSAATATASSFGNAVGRRPSTASEQPHMAQRRIRLKTYFWKRRLVNDPCRGWQRRFLVMTGVLRTGTRKQLRASAAILRLGSC